MAVATAALALAVTVVCGGQARAATLPAGFQERTVFSGLTNPSAVRFAADGRVFVAEKSGLVKVFTNLSDTTPTTFADLRTQVHNFWDRGLLGLALDPNFPANPYVYVLYTHDAAIGGTAPRWGTAGATSDGCPTPPGPTGDGCVVSGRLSRLQAAGDVMTSEQVLIEDWCQQYPSHSVGSLAFGADGRLYVSGGDGASFNFTDFGQDGSPLNPCGDPPVPVGGTQTSPTAEGGALRSQDVRTTTDPTGLDGAILRVDPATGAGPADNPLGSSPDADANERRIVAYGLRNPFRITTRPGTSEIWAGDVGWNDWEEINRIVAPADASADNFGWPCYEGGARQSGYNDANLNLCTSLYAQGAGAVTAPFYTWSHAAKVVPGESCPTGSSSAAGLSFYVDGPYPADYDGALFFSDYSRDCIWVMKRNGEPQPSPGSITTFAAGAANPVDVQVGPDGQLYYADFDGGTIRRVEYTAANQSPVAVVTANPTAGPTPLNVSFSGTGSSDPDAGDTLTYAWDLDGDGAYDDSTSATPTYTYTAAGTYAAGLQVTDNHGATGRASVTINAGNRAPTATITSPAAGTTWKVGDTITFAGSATDPEQGALPPSALSWSLVLNHCPSNCHTHPVRDYAGVAGDSFVTFDHEYPSYLELRLTATDAQGLTSTQTRRLDPRTVNVTLSSNPSGRTLTFNGASAVAPFTRTVIMGSNNSISAPSPQVAGNRTWRWLRWSDGGAQTHNIVAGATATRTATFRCSGPFPVCLFAGGG
jgi:glucose/arabinose dehydrogenase